MACGRTSLSKTMNSARSTLAVVNGLILLGDQGKLRRFTHWHRACDMDLDLCPGIVQPCDVIGKIETCKLLAGFTMTFLCQHI